VDGHVNFKLGGNYQRRQIAEILHFIVNRGQGIDRWCLGDSKNLIVFDPLLTGHVIWRMHSGLVRIFIGNQRETL